jgi:hypothetical protein
MAHGLPKPRGSERDDLLITILWDRATPQSILGSYPPVLSPDGAAVLVADGWGTAFSGLRLRRFNLTTGQEEASALLKDAAYCVVPDVGANVVFAVLGRRVLQLEGKSLQRIREWKKGIPHYCNHAVRCGPTLLLMNWFRPTLTTLSLDQAEAQKFRVGPCLRIFSLESSEALVCSGKEGRIWRYSPASGRPREVLKTGPFLAAAFAQGSQQLALAAGDPFYVGPDRAEQFKFFRSFSLFDLKAETSMDYELPKRFDFLAISDGGNRIILGDGSSVTACALANGKATQLWSMNLPAGFQVAAVSPDFTLLLGTRLEPSRILAASLRV